jgi:peptide-methionine (R)-S-oxide reductase
MMKHLLYLCLFTLSTIALAQDKPESNDIVKKDRDWKEILSPESYHVLREKGTEPPFSGVFNLHFEDGVYACKGCKTKLFKSSSKFKSNCGWPSFDAFIDGAVLTHRDLSHGMIRTEIVCANCDGHLGHVFDDGPTQTGLRYCVNSVSLDFKEE